MIILVPRRKVVDENDPSRRDGDLHLSPVEALGPRAGPGSVTPGIAVILDIKRGITDTGIPVLENGHTNTSMVAARSEIEEGMVIERGGIAHVNLVGSRETSEFQGEFRLPICWVLRYIYILDDIDLDITYTHGPESNTYQFVQSNVRLSLDTARIHIRSRSRESNLLCRLWYYV